MITKKLKEKVIQEATKLKNCATKEELDCLNFKVLVPVFRSNCIYGLLTGDCFSERALHLLNCCAVPYSRDVGNRKKTESKAFKQEYRTEKNPEGYRFSAMEFYICQPRAKLENLIDFLKSNKKLLTVQDL